jgi:hypothetical protein
MGIYIKNKIVLDLMKNALVLFTILLALATAASGGQVSGVIGLDKNFFYKLHRTPVVLRDSFLEGMLNSIVSGRGVITSIDAHERLKNRRRVVCIDRESKLANMSIVYNIYVADKDTFSLLKKDELFEFTGQLIAYTPLNSKRDSYILDIILEKGVMLFE